MLFRSAPITRHARRSLIPRTAWRRATASRFAAGVTNFLREDPSGPRCPASSRPAAASAWRSHPRAPAAASPPRPPGRHTWPSSCRSSRRTRRGAGLGLLQHANDLLFREPQSLHRPSFLQGRTLIMRGGKSGGHVTAHHITSLLPKGRSYNMPRTLDSGDWRQTRILNRLFCKSPYSIMPSCRINQSHSPVSRALPLRRR